MTKKEAQNSDSALSIVPLILRANVLYALITADLDTPISVGEVQKRLNQCSGMQFSTYQVNRELAQLKQLKCAVGIINPTRGSKTVTKWRASDDGYALLSLYQEWICAEFQEGAARVLNPILETARIVRKNCLSS